MTPLGYSPRTCRPGTGLADIDSDMAFKGNLAFQGTLERLPRDRRLRPGEPGPDLQHTRLPSHLRPGRRDRPRQHPRAHVGLARDGRERRRDVLRRPARRPQGFEGIHIWDISDPATPVYNPQGADGRRRATTRARPRRLRRAHGDRRAGRRARQPLPLRRRLERHLHRHRHRPHQAVRPERRASILRRATHGRTGVVPRQQRAHERARRHRRLRDVRGRQRPRRCTSSTWPSRPTRPARRRARAASRTRRCLRHERTTGVTIGHSGSFTYDGRLLIYGHEPGGGTSAECEENDTRRSTGRCSSCDPRDRRRRKGTMLHAAAAGRTARTARGTTSTSCRRTRATTRSSGNYQSGISVIDFTNPAAASEIAYADPAALQHERHDAGITAAATGRRTSTTGGSTSPTSVAASSSGSSITSRCAASRTPDTVEPADADRRPSRRTSRARRSRSRRRSRAAQFKQGSQQIADFSCTDSDSGVESCVGTVADGAAVNTSAMGFHTFTVTAKDRAGTETTKSVTYMVNSMDVQIDAGGDGAGDAVDDAGHARPRSARSRRASRGTTTRARPPT